MAKIREKKPIDRLYGEENAIERTFWLHCETIFSRSHLYRFEIHAHHHDAFFQILYISDGRGDAILDVENLPIVPPSLIIVPPGIDHGFRFSPDIQGHIITIVPAALSAALQGLIHRVFTRAEQIALGEHGALQTLFLNLVEEYEGERVARLVMIEAQLAALLGHIARAAHQRGAGNLSAYSQKVEAALHLIALNCKKGKQARFYADALGLSPTHVSRLLKAETGRSLKQWIMQKQLESACQELVFSHASVEEVAERHGFADSSYFTRVFLRETGMTPRKYRVIERQKLNAL